MTVLTATTYQQACIAAEQLGLRRGEWSYASDRYQVMGLLPTRVIHVRPKLGDWKDWERLRAIEDELYLRAIRARVTPEYVYT